MGSLINVFSFVHQFNGEYYLFSVCLLLLLSILCYWYRLVVFLLGLTLANPSSPREWGSLSNRCHLVLAHPLLLFRGCLRVLMEHLRHSWSHTQTHTHTFTCTHEHIHYFKFTHCFPLQMHPMGGFPMGMPPQGAFMPPPPGQPTALLPVSTTVQCNILWPWLLVLLWVCGSVTHIITREQMLVSTSTSSSL